MKYWLDTEFIEDGKTIDLISIGIVAEDGRELYCEVSGVDWGKASQWVLDNVKPLLWHLREDKYEANAWFRDGGVGGLMSLEHIAREIRVFVDPTSYGKPEFWGWYCDYDWVVLCQLFGTMMDLPSGWPMFCMDAKQLCHSLGNPGLDKQQGEHNALADARWIRGACKFLEAYWPPSSDL